MTASAAEAATDAPSTSEVVTKATDKAAEVTPAPDVPAVQHVPEVSKPDDRIDAIETTVNTLAETVNTLANAVTGTIEPDETPHSKPWTHWGSK